MAMQNSDLVSGWQEIADYLDKSARTLHRWAHRKGLPVKYPAGVGSTPYASKKSLDEWVLGRAADSGPAQSDGGKSPRKFMAVK